MLTSERQGKTYVVRAEGEVDLGGAGPLDEEMRRVEATDVETIVLDLSELEFMDCSGIRLLLDLQRRSTDDGRRLRMIRGAGQVDRLVKLTGVDETLPFAA